jgi:hypothetical protein
MAQTVHDLARPATMGTQTVRPGADPRQAPGRARGHRCGRRVSAIRAGRHRTADVAATGCVQPSLVHSQGPAAGFHVYRPRMVVLKLRHRETARIKTGAVVALAALGFVATSPAADAASATPAVTRHCGFVSQGSGTKFKGLPNPLVFGAPDAVVTGTFSGPGVYHHAPDGQGHFYPSASFTLQDAKARFPDPVARYQWSQSPLRKGAKARWVIHAIDNSVPPNGGGGQGPRVKGNDYVAGDLYTVSGGAGGLGSSDTYCPFVEQTIRVKSATAVTAHAVQNGADVDSFAIPVVTHAYNFAKKGYTVKAEPVQLLLQVNGAYKVVSSARTPASGLLSFTGSSATPLRFEVRTVPTTSEAGSTSAPFAWR